MHVNPTLVYDDASRIIRIEDPSPNRVFTYDELDRIRTATVNAVKQEFTYDVNGNRRTHNSATYTYETDKNRLSSTGSVAYTYDSNGSATAIGPHILVYDSRGRLEQFQRKTAPVGNVDFKVNALGQRVGKTFGGAATVFHYDVDGRLIAESDGSGAIQKEYVYLNNQPIAVLTTGTVPVDQAYNDSDPETVKSGDWTYSPDQPGAFARDYHQR